MRPSARADPQYEPPMCLILVVWRVHPQYPCIIAANRDEFHERATASAAWWSDRPHILAGRDIVAGGAWLGLTRSGRFAALTNFRGPRARRSEAPSRGALVTSMLETSGSVPANLTELERIGAQFNGFNLIFSDGERLGVHESERAGGRELGPGIYGLSNHLLDTPWPKVQWAKSRLQTALADLPDTASVLSLLRDDRPAPDDQLPRTGVSLEWERMLSSAFVRSADYGTRCSTVVCIDRHGEVSFDEWAWDPSGAESARTSLRFALADRA